MKTKMLKKLIAVVCAVTMATSCAAMSAGAVPIGETEQVDWVQEGNRVMTLVNRTKEASKFEEYWTLADEIEAFVKGEAYNILFEEADELKQGSLNDVIEVVLSGLRAEGHLETCENGADIAVDFLSDVASLIEKHK